jgi:hypothetical protein
MDLTTGALLRRITRTDLSVSAHKLATLILDRIAWKDGYNGLPRGTAAFALSDLAARMAVSRQYLHSLLAELAASGLRLVRARLRGRRAIWLFRFGCVDEVADEVSATGDSVPYREESHKTIFSGMIVLDCESAAWSERWLGMIDRAKAALPCRAMTSRHIWERFREFNRRKGKQAVPAGYLLGFMRRWRVDEKATPTTVAAAGPAPKRMRQPIPELQRLIALAPIANRRFHQRDLIRQIGEDAYRRRVTEAAKRFDCGNFSAELAVHGMAVKAGEIGR